MSAAPLTTEHWSTGTDLRDDASGLYKWPPATFNPSAQEEFISVTNVLDATFGSDLIFVHNWAIASYVEELTQASVDGQSAVMWVGYDDQGEVTEDAEQAVKFIQEEGDPIKLLLQPHYIKNAGFRKMRMYADRGSTIHDCLEAYSIGMPSPGSYKEIQEYVADLIVCNKRTCTPEYVTPYAVGLYQFLAEHLPVVSISETAGFNWTLRYAGTLDMRCQLPKIDASAHFLVDCKTSKEARLSHWFQQAAYKKFEYVGIKKTDRLVEMPAVDRAAILLVQPNSYKLVQPPEDDRDLEIAWQGFCHAIAAWHILERYGRAASLKPPTVPRPTKRQVRGRFEPKPCPFKIEGVDA